MLMNAAAIGLPTLMVLVGILLNRNDANRLDARLTSLDASLRGEIAALRGEIAGVRGEVTAARNQSHNDVPMLIGSDREQDKRITRLEETVERDR